MADLGPWGRCGARGSAVLCLAIVSSMVGCRGVELTLPASACDELAERIGRRVCVHELRDRERWEEISFRAAAADQVRATTYLVPASEEARLPVLLVDANAFEDPRQSLHYQFLTESVEDLAALEYAEYLALVLDRDSREWFAGSVTEYLVPGDDPVFGFTVADRGTDPDETIRCDEMARVHAALSAAVGIGEVVAIPGNDLQRSMLEDCDVPSYDPAMALEYEVYTRTHGCGTLRRLTLRELSDAEARGDLGFQDLLVVDEAPLDVETVIAGIVTGTRQGELSHLNVRSASRGTPNCYLRDALEILAEWEGELVELECGPVGVLVNAITPEQARDCQEAIKPEPARLVPADLAVTELVPLATLPTDSAAERRSAVARFGSKGANLATLYQRIDPALQLTGFLVPLHYYDAFVHDNGWEVDLGDGPETLTFAETIDRYLADDALRTDAAVRRDRLTALRDAMRAASCDPALEDAIAAQVEAVFGGRDVMVRFRSSSNAEDALGFNGAGLYDSTSVCVADGDDADDLGPSLCDPDQTGERSICRGLTRVWASLWNMKAFEEREWYRIDHADIAMGVLVNTRSKGEQANVVAFTGNPLVRGDDRFLVNAQLGELDVVSAVPGVWPEKALLTLDGGAVTDIERARASTEVAEGEHVLDDARLEELGAALWSIREVYPVDEEVPPTVDVLLDTEWKVLEDGRLIVKQVRPFAD